MSAVEGHNGVSNLSKDLRDDPNWIARELEAAEFERLYRESLGAVYALILFKMRDEEAAREVTSEAFLRAARHFNRFDPLQDTFLAWVSSIALNCMSGYQRENKQCESSASIPSHEPETGRRPAGDEFDADLVRRFQEELGKH